MFRKREYLLWHPDSPGVKVLVLRRIRPRSPFARIGEYYLGRFAPIDLTENRGSWMKEAI